MSEVKNGCRKVGARLEAYFEGVLPEAEERMVAEHLWQCPRCASELEQIRRLAVFLNEAPVAQPEEALLAAISARLAALPEGRPASRGWKRLGLAEVLVLAGVAAIWYLCALVGPHFFTAAAPAWSYASGLTQHAAAWATGSYSAALDWLGGVAGAASSWGQAARHLAPRLVLYLAIEVALVSAAAFLIRRRRPQVALSRQLHGRRS